MKRKILLSSIFLLLLIQFFRPAKNQGEAQTARDIEHSVQVPDSVLKILKVSCYDCHSNHTEYLWYHEIMPLGWWLDHHVEEGKAELNFSEFAAYELKRKDHKLEEIAEVVKEHEMPLTSYTLLHPEAKLDEAEIKLLADWAAAQRQGLK